MTNVIAPVMKLDPAAAFFHVIDAHRWLAASGCSWNLLTAKNSKDEVRATSDALLPNVDVMVRDCALLHARSLIDFYTKCHASDTDILLCDFNGLSIEPALKDALEEHKNPIEVHLLHLTAWRDWDYRIKYATGKNRARTRPNWDESVAPLVVLILDALKCASDQVSRWKQPFTELCKASTARYQDKSSIWPHNLGEKDAVEVYLHGLKLP